MSYNHYNLDGVKTEICKELNRARALLTEWKKVTFPAKKDGTPFKVMSKNISGATYTLEPYAMQPGEYEIRVTTFANGLGYISDEIKAHELVKYLKDENKRVKTHNFQPKQMYLEQVYTFDLDDIKEAVNKRIEYLQKEIAQLEQAHEIAPKAYAAFKAAYGAAIEQLAKDANKAENSTLYYMVLDTVKERYPYC